MSTAQLKSFVFGITAISLTGILGGCGTTAPTCDAPLTQESIEYIFLDTLRQSPFYGGGATGVEGMKQQQQRKFEDSLTLESQKKLKLDPNSEPKQFVRVMLSDIKKLPTIEEGAIHSCKASISITPADTPTIDAYKFAAEYNVTLKNDTYSVEIKPSDDLRVAHRILQTVWILQRAKKSSAKQ